MEKNKLSYDPNDIALAYNLKVNKSCDLLNEWISASATFNDFEQAFFEKIYKDAHVDASYWNEEELKIKMVGLLFSLADIEMSDKAKVFYERAISAKVGNYDLAVICDCLVATHHFHSINQLIPIFSYKNLRKREAKKTTPRGNS